MGCSEVSGNCLEHPCSQLPLKTATGKTPNRLPLIRLSIFVVSTLLMAVIKKAVSRQPSAVSIFLLTTDY